jgi:RNA polymerase sigma factor for flagellar operon FliA
MSDRKNAEILFLEHLGWIDRVAALACRQHGISGVEAEDFASRVKMQIMEDDYALLRKFRGESTLKTYISTAVVKFFHEYIRERYGRWRPSAAARRLGPPAPDLEALVYRDGFRLDQAGERLRTSGRTSLSDAELARLLTQLPVRGPLRPIEIASDAVLNAIDHSERADERIVAEAAAQRMGEGLRRAISLLAPEDQMIVRMHLQDGRPLADVARVLRLEQKPLYRRVEKLRNRLRQLLRAEGLTGQDVAGLDIEDT